MTPLGTIRFTWDDLKGVATLGIGGRWFVPGWETLADSLDTRFPGNESGPADGVAGRRVILAASRWLKERGAAVTIDLPDLPDAPDGHVGPMSDLGKRLGLNLPDTPGERIY